MKPSWSNFRQTSVVAICLATALIVAGGCSQTASEPSPDATGTEPKAMWDVLYMRDARVGYGSSTVGTETHQGESVLHVEGVTRMKFRRAGLQMEIGTRFDSRQTLDGQLLDFETAMLQGTIPVQQTRGKVVDDTLNLEIVVQEKTSKTSIPWSAEYGGPFASQIGLLQKPMTPGQSRTVHEWVPEVNVVAVVEMTARDYESVKVLDQTHELLRIDVTTTFPGKPRLRSTRWTDRAGDILRDHQEAMDLDTFRTTKEVALQRLDRAEFDLVHGLSVNVDRRLTRPHDTKRIRYRIDLDGGNPVESFPAGSSQQIRLIDDHAAELTVHAVRPDQSGNPDAPADEPTDHDLESTPLIQSDDPKITAAAGKIASEEKDTWQLAVALERYVHEKITSANYSQAFDSAVEVLETGEGDCTEHAVLLAAVARARGIPARVVVGLVYTLQTGRPSFGYHMWNELYIDGRWIAMDATMGRGGIGAAHVKLADSPLQGASALDSFLPVGQVAGRLRIEIIDVEP